MAVSSDGVVTAVVDAITASVLLTVNFTSAPPAAGIVTVTVTRTVAGVSSRVRGMHSTLGANGVKNGIDHEAPQGVACTYQATITNLAGTVVATSTTVVATITQTSAWLKSLLFPALSQAVLVQTYPEWSFPINQGTFFVDGASGPVVVSDVRQYPTGSLILVTQTAVAQNSLQVLLSSAGPFLVQFPAVANEPDRYVSVGPFVPARPVRLSANPDRYFTLPLTCVAKPVTDGSVVAIPGKTYADSKVAFPLYSNRNVSSYLVKS